MDSSQSCIRNQSASASSAGQRVGFRLDRDLQTQSNSFSSNSNVGQLFGSSLSSLYAVGFGVSRRTNMRIPMNMVPSGRATIESGYCAVTQSGKRCSGFFCDSHVVIACKLRVVTRRTEPLGSFVDAIGAPSRRVEYRTLMFHPIGLEKIYSLP